MKYYNAFTTLLYAWGGDTPPEAIWAANEFLRILEVAYPVLVGLDFQEDNSTGINDNILDTLKTLP